MRLRLLAFATAADALGANETGFEIADGATVGDLRSALSLAHPGLEPLWPRLAVAIDGLLAADTALLHDGAEVALLPPVSGG
jgi:molybdopterin converting factor small subunit